MAQSSVITPNAKLAENRLENNLRLIAKYQPDITDKLYAQIKQLDGISGNKNDNKAEIVQSKSGIPTLKYGDIYIHSAYDPQKEAQRFVENLTFDKFINIAVLGVGLGYHIEEILEKSGENDFMLIIEKEISIFKKFLEEKDLNLYYGKSKLYFAIDKKPIDIFRALQGCSLTIFANGLTVIKHPPSIKVNPQYYDEISEKIKDIFQWARVNTISQINASNDFAKNIFANMPAYLNIAGIKRLFDKFEGLSGIVISAGPSLIKNIRLLKEAQGKCVLIAVDTSLRVLLKHGIEPDIVVSIDYTSHNNRYFQRIPKLNAALAVDPEVYPDIISGYHGPKFMISLPGKSLCDWLSAVVEDKGGMDKGLSVAHTAFLLGTKLGLSPIGLVGQDLSFPGKMTHVRGSAMARKSTVTKEQSDTTFVNDIFGGKTITSTSMHIFIKHFEEMIDKNKTKCYDLTEGGAYISGANPMPLKEFIILNAKKIVDIKKIINEEANNKTCLDKKYILNELRKTISGLKNVYNICEDGKKILNNIEKAVSDNKSNYNLTKLLTQWARVSKELHSRKDVFVVLGNNITDVMVLQSKKDGFDFNNIDKHNIEAMLPYIKKEEAIYSRLSEQSDIFYNEFCKFEKLLLRLEL